MNLYVITIEECRESLEVLRYEKRTVTIPADDLDAAMILLQDAQNRLRYIRSWGVVFLYSEPMKELHNKN